MSLLSINNSMQNGSIDAKESIKITEDYEEQLASNPLLNSLLEEVLKENEALKKENTRMKNI